MKWKQTILLSLLISVLATVNGSHLVGAEGYYECLGGSTYEITYILYEEPGAATEDLEVVVTIFDNDDGLVYDQFSIYYDNKENLETTYENDCTGEEFKDDVNKFLFQETVSLPNNTNGYEISYWRCCRPPSLENVEDDLGMGITMSVPGGGICNSTPKFDNEPVNLLCLNEPFDINFSATDPDGDDLVYKLYTPRTSGDVLGQIYSQAIVYSADFGPSYDPVDYKAGYSGTNPFGNNVLAMATDGILSGMVDATGDYYVLGVEVEEWRNGVKLGSIIRDIPITVVDCGRLQAAVLDAALLDTALFNNTGATCERTISFTNESSNATTAQWDFGVQGTNTDVSSDINPTFTFPAAGDYEITLIAGITNSTTCKDTAKTIITIMPDPVAGFTYETFCNSNKALFTNTTETHGMSTTYNWEFTGPNQSTTASIDSFTFNNAGTYNVLLGVENVDGCTDSIEIPVTVGDDKAEITLTADLVDICPGETITYTATGGSSYEYWVNDVKTGNSDIFSSNTLQEGDTVTAILGPGTGCTDTAKMVVVAAAEPNFSISTTDVCINEATTLEAQGASIQSVNWDHSGSNTMSISANTSTAGSVWYYGVGVDNRGCTSRDSVELTVFPLPLVSAGNDQEICAGGSITLQGSTNNDGAITTWAWDNGASTQTPNVNPSANTRYLLTATDNNGCEDTASVLVEIGEYKPVIPNDAITLCFGNDATLSINDGSNHEWSLEDGTIISNNANYTFTPNATQLVILNAYDNSGSCQGKDTVSITVNGLPDVDAGPSKVICTGQSTTLSPTLNTTTPISSWEWTGANNIQHPTVGPTTSTQYELTVTDNNGCKDTSSTWVNITEYKPEILDDDIEICTGETVNLQVLFGSNFRWLNPNQETISTQSSIDFTPTISGQYIILADDADGTCIDGRDTANIIIHERLGIGVGNDVSVCDGEAFTVTAEESTGKTQWYRLENGTLIPETQSPLFYKTEMSDLEEEIYVWEVIDEQCDSTLYDTVTVSNQSKDIRDIVLEDQASEEEFTYEFTTYYSGDLDWIIDGEHISSDTVCEHYFEESGMHTIMLRASNEFGCEEIRTKEIFTERATTLFMPNAFVPDQTEEKDYRPVGLFTEIENYSFAIFNRWGEKVFMTDDVEQGWNGIIRQSSRKGEQGTYVYKINYEVKGSNEKNVLTGNFLLLE